MASYIFRLDSFRITRTRALHEDSDIVAFAVKVGDQPVELRTLPKKNYNDGTFSTGLEVGPITVDSDMQMAVSYQIVNSGYNDRDEATVEEVLNALSDGAEKLCTGLYGYAGVWQALNRGVHWLNSLIFANCDGVVAADAIALTGDDLDASTAAGGTHTETRFYPGSDSPIGCGRNSKYYVTWSVERVGN